MSSSSSSSLYLDNYLHGSYAGHSLLREWNSSDTVVSAEHLMYPVFIVEGSGIQEAIKGLPDQYRFSVDTLVEFLEPLVSHRGLRSVLLFGVITDPSKKSPTAAHATHSDAPVLRALTALRSRFPSLLLAVDLCLCAYTDHGHCCIFAPQEGQEGAQRMLISNALSTARIADIAEAYARHGAHVIAPSDMMDCRIRAIKERLHATGFENTVAVMSYSAKFASSFYGPFREAAHSAPSFGDRQAYQLPPGSRGLALRALKRDIKEGADIIMVKPAMAYLDVIRDASNLQSGLPIAAYHVSGEYAMLHAAGVVTKAIDLPRALQESFVALRRAGVTIIITYFTPFYLELLQKKE